LEKEFPQLDDQQLVHVSTSSNHVLRLAIAAVFGIAVAAALLAGIASAGASAEQQRVAIAFNQNAGTFVLTPLTAGPMARDTGTYTSCCWTQFRSTRDGQSIEIDNPTVSFNGKHGTFTWNERITFVDINDDYTVATATWTIAKGGTGAYAHLEGHGREAAVNRTDGGEVAAKAEGLVDLGP
jgi:hypothetical protein